VGRRPALTTGARGQFTIRIDGDVVFDRSRNVLRRMVGGGWPDPEAIVTEIKSRIPARDGA
jgi:predicted Rdx family selenoprotein